MKKIVIILPTYNEHENIADMISLVAKQREKIPHWNLEILVSDSNSPDGTLDEVGKIKTKIAGVYGLNVEKRGLGVGLKLGYDYAFQKLNADAVLQMDADLQHDPNDIPKFTSELDHGADFVQGSRFIKGGENRLQWYRKLFSWGANLVSKSVMGIWNMTEFTASYRAFTREIYDKLDFKSIPWSEPSFLFQPALTYAVSNVARKMKEVPIIFTDRRKGYSKMQIVQYMKDIMTFAVKVRLQKSGRFFKFLVVGGIGFIINYILLRVLTDKAGLAPAVSNLIGAEMAIISNFIWNNLWTFTDRKITSLNSWVSKLLQFNLTSIIGVFFIQTGIVFLGVQFFGKPLYQLYWLLGTGLLLVWNFTVYSKIIWKKK